MKIEDACPTCGALCEVDLDADEEEYVAIDVAARATAEQSEPYGYVYEWDCSPGVVHRDFVYGTYNGRYPDRTVPVYAALKSQQDAAIESKPAEQSMPKLDKRAQVGNTRFGVGVKWSTVIGAAQRYHDFMNMPEKEGERIAKAQAFHDAMADAAIGGRDGTN